MLIRPRWQKVLTDLWGNLTRSMLVVGSITVGLVAIGIISTIYVVISTDMSTGYKAINPANIKIQTGLIKDEMVHHIGNIKGVRQTEGFRSVTLRVINANGLWQDIDITAFRNMDQLTINKLGLIEGRWPKDGEIVLDKNRLDELNVHIGDWIQIELPSNKIRKLLLVGVVQDQNIGAFDNGGGFFTAPAQGYIHPDTLAKLEQTQTDLFNGVFATLKGDGGDLNAIQNVSSTINHDLKFNNVDVTNIRNDSSSDHPNATIVDAVLSILIVLGILTVFLSCFLVTNTLQALLKQQTIQIGIMKSVGASQNQVAGVYITLILIFGILGFLISVPAANLVAFPLLGFVANKLNIVLGEQRLEMSVVGMQAVLAVLMPLIAAWQPIWEGSKISVIEALTAGLHSNRKKKGKTQKQTPLKSSWFSRILDLNLPQVIALRNTFRQKGRLALTLSTLSLAGAIFITTFNVQVSLDKYISQIRQYDTGDISLVLKHPYPDQEIIRLLQQVPGVRLIEIWTSEPARLILADGSSAEQIDFIAPPADSVIVKPVLKSGRWVRVGDRNAIVLDDAFQSIYPDLHVGNSLRLKINDKNTDWVVVGFFQLGGKMDGYVAYTNYDYMAKLTNNTHQDYYFQILGDKKGLNAVEEEQLKKLIESNLNTNHIQVANLSTGASDSSSTSGGLNTLNIFLLFMSILIAIVGSIGLAGTMSMNVMERTREIGILRSIGASDPSLMQIVLSEGLTIGLVSYAIAVFLSIPITILLGNSVIMAIFGSTGNLAYTFSGYGIWLCLVVVLSIIASIVPAHNAAKLTIREVLSYE